ncbi:MAG TPA: (d)CMP kinase [Gemmatimonadaceae bacterium]|nr:(d)CMP kinase [Gemmatimonadaceae bacterium]
MKNDSRRIVVAIDGPAASGKSSTAHRVAERLGMHHGDSGALYRAATVARLRDRRAGEPEQWTAESVLSAASRVAIVRNDSNFGVTLDGKSVGPELHEAAVTALVSLVAKMQPVRDWVNDQMRRCARDGSIVVDGRDMGTTVFPEAQLKIFLVANANERARRRLLQRLGRTPMDEEVAAEAEALKQRDAKDAAQTRQAPDAIVIDTTHLTQDDQVDRIVELARKVISAS